MDIKIDVAGLEPKDIKLLFDGIHNHALNWNDVEQAVLQQSLDLDIAAKTSSVPVMKLLI